MLFPSYKFTANGKIIVGDNEDSWKFPEASVSDRKTIARIKEALKDLK